MRSKSATFRTINFLLALGMLVSLLVTAAHLPTRPGRAAASGVMAYFTGQAGLPDWIAFTPTDSMNLSRQKHTATHLLDGRVLVAGGQFNTPLSLVLSSAELYDPASDAWSLTGSMHVTRTMHTATLLADGRVLVTGGREYDFYGGTHASAEIYDPSSGDWSLTGNMYNTREGHTATRLLDGRVLVVGGQDSAGGITYDTAELYDPATGVFTTTGTLTYPRYLHSAVLLDDGQVLVAGGVGSDQRFSEIYDPVSGAWSLHAGQYFSHYEFPLVHLPGDLVLAIGGYLTMADPTVELYDRAANTWTTVAPLTYARAGHTAHRLDNGLVLAIGGETAFSVTGPYTCELYNPDSDTWHVAGELSTSRSFHTSTQLPDGRLLVAGGYNPATYQTQASAELGTFMPANTLTGTLGLPSGWQVTRTFTTTWLADAAAAGIQAAALSNDGLTWSEWITTNNSITTTASWQVDTDGAALPVYLRLRDVNGQEAAVVSGTLAVDSLAPSGTITAALGAEFTPRTAISVTLSAADLTSGVSEVQLSNDGAAWSAWQPYTTTLDWELTPGDGTKMVYAHFRDAAGNISLPASDNLILDTTAPTPLDLTINGGALTTASLEVHAALSAEDATTQVAWLSLSNDGSNWSTWQSYAASATWALAPSDETKTVYARFADTVMNISTAITDTIQLDTTVSEEYGFTINQGALYTNQTGVTLSIGSLAGTAQMRVSNDGGFASAIWEPYTSQRSWIITAYGDYVIPRVVYLQYKDSAGVVSATYQDDIILDVNPPTGSIEVLFQTGALRAAGTVTFQLSAQDDVSGVSSMRISPSADFSGSDWQAYTTTYSWDDVNGTLAYAQFQDHAGNVSAVYTSGQRLYLPLVIH